jgi:cytochrome c peroxidase
MLRRQPRSRRAFSVIGLSALAALGACSTDHAPLGELSPKAQLGEQLFFDTALSASGRQGCFSCHDPAHAFADPAPVSMGGPNFVPSTADAPAQGRPGLRNSPSLSYASFTPAFHYEDDGTAVGGFFRDGRAASLAAQAQKPYLSPFEMANADAAEVISRLAAQRDLLHAFTAVFGSAVLERPDEALADIGQALAAFEIEDPRFRAFSSKFDAYQRGDAQFSAQERNGLRLFEDPERGNCAACHPSTPASAATPALFTDFSYDNLGVPRNTALAANDDVGAPDYVPRNGNDGVHPFYDLGLCGPLRSDQAAATSNCGAFKVPSLRNVALTAPYFHNGRFATLREALSFYVTRDTDPTRWYPGDVARFDDLPAADAGNVNTEEVPYNRHAGDAPALSLDEIDDVIAFLCTLTDGFDPLRPGAYALPAQCPR